jgi:hypothetical protein
MLGGIIAKIRGTKRRRISFLALYQAAHGGSGHERYLADQARWLEHAQPLAFGEVAQIANGAQVGQGGRRQTIPGIFT